MRANAKFITVEGIDGAGKSSHLEAIAGRIRASGHEVVLTREPGGTPLGERLREIVLHEPMHPASEVLILFAARSEHLAAVIEPALAAGRWVVCDRFTDATFAYQCGGRGMDREVVRALERVVHPGRQPDVTFLFDLDPGVAAARQQAQGRAPDRFEREQAEFFARVRAAYLERAGDDPRRFRVIDASGPLEAVRARLEARLDEVLA